MNFISKEKGEIDYYYDYFNINTKILQKCSACHWGSTLEETTFYLIYP